MNALAHNMHTNTRIHYNEHRPSMNKRREENDCLVFHNSNDNDDENKNAQQNDVKCVGVRLCAVNEARCARSKSKRRLISTEI